jgi:hypothetical protein
MSEFKPAFELFKWLVSDPDNCIKHKESSLVYGFSESSYLCNFGKYGSVGALLNFYELSPEHWIKVRRQKTRYFKTVPQLMEEFPDAYFDRWGDLNRISKEGEPLRLISGALRFMGGPVSAMHGLYEYSESWVEERIEYIEVE